MKDIIRENYRVWLPADLDPSEFEDGNADVHVYLENGEHYFATFFTMRNIESLIKKFRETGECSFGLYFWAAGMIIVEGLSEDTVIRTIDQLLVESQFQEAFDGPLNDSDEST